MSVLLPCVSERVCRGNDPESEVDGKPGILVVIGVTVEGGAVPTEDVLQSPIGKVPPL